MNLGSRLSQHRGCRPLAGSGLPAPGTRWLAPRQLGVPKWPNSNQAHQVTQTACRRASCQVRAASSSAVAEQPPQPADVDAKLISRPIKDGEVLAFEGNVVVLGDVPAGAQVSATGDVVVTGWLQGEVNAGTAGSRDCMVVAMQRSSTAKITINGVAAPQQAGLGQMAVLENSEVVFKPMPGSASLAAPSAGPAIEASQVGSGLVLLLGVALAMAPATVLGGLLHTGSEGLVAALLECAVYGYILLQGANLLGEGSEMLLEILNPGIIGGVVLPVLGAVPDSLIILNAGLHAAPEEAQQEVAVGVGTLAGSTILLLSLAWGGSMLLGACDLDEQGRAKDKVFTRGFDLETTGVSVDDGVRRGALVMAASVLLYGFVQVPALLGYSNDPEAALVGGIACLSAAVIYCVYSVLDPERQKRRIEAAQKKRFRQYAVKVMASRAAQPDSMMGNLIDSTGDVNLSAVDSLFDEFDTDKSGHIDMHELKGFVKGLELSGAGDSSLQYAIEEFDLNKDQEVSRQEFRQVLTKWVREKLSDQGHQGAKPGRYLSLVEQAQAQALLASMPAQDVDALKAIADELEGEGAEEAADDMEGEEGGASEPMTSTQIALQASLRLGAGVALCSIFSDPLVDALSNLSKVTGVPPFFVGFVLTPLASNASELVSSLQFAARKRKKNMSLTFSQVYGAVTMNNTLVLGLFLLVVYLQKLEWVYSSEVLIIVAGSCLIGFLGYSSSNFKTKLAIPSLALYPASLLAVYLLDTYLGWQ